MRARNGAAFWAIVLIGVGAVFLLQNLGILRVGWGMIWPVILILFGAFMLLGSFGRRGSTESRSSSVPLEGAREANVRIHQGAGRLVIGPSSDLMALVNNTFDGEIEQSVRRDGDRLEVKLRQEHDWTFWMWPWNWGGTGWHWTVNLNRDVPLSLEVKPGASQSEIDLRDLKVKSFRLDTGASTVDLTVPASGQVTGRVKAGASTIRIRVPDGVAARVRASLGAATLHVRGNRFPMSGGLYQSPEFDTAANRIDLDIDAGAATIDII
jgi:hypothetical protein